LSGARNGTHVDNGDNVGDDGSYGDVDSEDAAADDDHDNDAGGSNLATPPDGPSV